MTRPWNFTKGSGKHDRMEVMRADELTERIDCPPESVADFVFPA